MTTLAWRDALRWRFGAGAARVLPKAIVMPETGRIGSGNSVTVPCLPDEAAMERFGHVERYLVQIEERHRLTLALYHGDAGEVATSGSMYPSRRWRAVAPLTEAAEEQAAAWVERVDHQGDAPTSILVVEVAQAAKASLRGSSRTDAAPPAIEPPFWARPLTTTPETPEADRPEHRRSVRDLRAGPPAWRWVQWALDSNAKPKPSREDRAALERAEAEAKALVRAAEDAFASVYVPHHEDRR